MSDKNIRVIEVLCPNCQGKNQLTVGDLPWKRRVNCSKCGHEIAVPAEADEPARPPKTKS